MKKNLFFTSLFAGLGLAAFGQLPVSTSPENKNVVLEEFTGIYCTFCPDGHLRANNLAAANPGDVVLINIHAGSFAAPQGSDPDFRIPFGAAIDNQADVPGYPAGSINRRVFPSYVMSGSNAFAMSRGDWANAADTILNEGSYVNVALEGDVDLSTNTLTVDVEMYFTGSTAPSSVNLNVALLQNNIAGPQTGAFRYPAQILPDGQYNHQHMLRDLLTGQWGDVITTTTMGSTVQKTYTYTLPASVNGIPLSPGDLEIVVFVAEGQTNIMTGASGPLTYTLPSGASFADLGAADATPLPADFCATMVTPEVAITNNESYPLDSFEVSYIINGGTAVSQWVTTSLAAGATTNITFPAVSLAVGENNLSYQVSVDGVTKYFDLNSNNNSGASPTIFTVPAAPFATSHYESFENEAVFAPAPPNAIALNPNAVRAFVVDNSINSSVNQDIGAYENSSKSFRWNFFSIELGEQASLVYEKIDLSANTANEIVFDYAYAQYQNEDDQLEVRVSDDCGATWSTIFDKKGSDLSTRAPFGSGNWYPVAADWKTEKIGISNFDGTPELLVEFRGTSGFGNNLYVDNIQFFNSSYVGLDEEKSLTDNISLFPNPATNQFVVDLNLADFSALDVEVEITDLSGKVFFGKTFANTSTSQLEIDAQEFSAGVYLVKVSLNGSSHIERLTVK